MDSRHFHVLGMFMHSSTKSTGPVIPASCRIALGHMDKGRLHAQVLAQPWNRNIRHYCPIQTRTCEASPRLLYSSTTLYQHTQAFSSGCVNRTGKFRKPRHVPKPAKMSWMDSWSRPSKHQATPAPYYLLPGGEDTPYCKTCGRVIGEL